LIAAELQALDFKIGGHRATPDWRVLKGWRDRLSKLDKDSVERRVYEALCSELPNSLATNENQFRVLVGHCLRSTIVPGRSVLE
jgi:hypothetical protein